MNFSDYFSCFLSEKSLSRLVVIVRPLATTAVIVTNFYLNPLILAVIDVLVDPIKTIETDAFKTLFIFSSNCHFLLELSRFCSKSFETFLTDKNEKDVER